MSLCVQVRSAKRLTWSPLLQASVWAGNAQALDLAAELTCRPFSLNEFEGKAAELVKG